VADERERPTSNSESRHAELFSGNGSLSRFQAARSDFTQLDDKVVVFFVRADPKADDDGRRASVRERGSDRRFALTKLFQRAA
jgi:hypothetical protein